MGEEKNEEEDGAAEEEGETVEKQKKSSRESSWEMLYKFYVVCMYLQSKPIYTVTQIRNTKLYTSVRQRLHTNYPTKRKTKKK